MRRPFSRPGGPQYAEHRCGPHHEPRTSRFLVTASGVAHVLHVFAPGERIEPVWESWLTYWGHTLRFTVFGLALFVLAGCSGDSVTVSPCTQADEGSPCATGEVTADWDGRYWNVATHQTVSEEVKYVEAGVQCVRYSTYCQTTTCSVGGAITRDQAIAFCRRR